MFTAFLSSQNNLTTKKGEGCKKMRDVSWKKRDFLALFSRIFKIFQTSIHGLSYTVFMEQSSNWWGQKK
ncbi:hypothetical protein B5G50_27095 [Brevibacillus brevis]|nr:hypothetical protein B5G50_27095 [Brevibacillus brevis]